MKTLSKLFKGDKVIWVIFFCLSFISLLAVYSSIGLSAIEVSGTTPLRAFFKHVVIVLLTYVTVIFISNIDYRRFSKLSLYAFLFSIALLCVVLAMGGNRWIRIPGFGQFQPSEVAKVALVVFVARQLTLHRDDVDTKETFFKILIPVVFTCALIFPENFSTAALLFLVCLVLMFFGGVNRKMWFITTITMVVLAVGGLTVLYKYGNNIEFFRSSTWGHRIESWLHPDPDELTQENMAKMAIASGKFFGVGIGNTVHARLMTQAHNDFIFAIIIEEKGMMAAIFIFLLYSAFYFQCIRLSLRCKGRFGALSVAGMGSLIYFQALVNMCVAVGVLPVTGQTLPFISYGGTAYLLLGVGLGVIQAVARDTIKQEKSPVQVEESTQDETNL